MRSRFLDAYNAVNLLRNGGLDFGPVGNEDPPFWEIVNASQGAVPPDNSYSIMKAQTPESELGAANYYRFALVSDRVIEAKYDFRERYQEQTYGKTTPPWIQDKDIPESIWISGGYKVLESHLIRGIDVTVAFSIKVPQGKVRVSLLMDYEPNPPSQDEIVIYDGLASREWVRSSTVVHIAGRRLGYFSIQIQRLETGSTEVHLGAISMVRGSVNDLPYTGDPAAEALPKGAIVLAFGEFCPPGFQKMSFASPPRLGRVFPMSSDSPSLTVEGEEVHDHSEAEMTMNPELDWPMDELVPHAGPTVVTPADNAEDSHQHDIVRGTSVPPTKDVILCKRL